MRIGELTKAGFFRIRKPNWISKDCYLQLDAMPGGGHGPWGHLFDPETQRLIGAPTPQDVLIVGDETDDWEAYQQKEAGGE